MRRRTLLPSIALLLAGCSALPSKPARPALYDFGPEPSAASATAPARPALVLPEVETSGILETPALLYRLGYDDPNELRPYAYARWSAPPGQLLRQRLRDVLGRDRPVLDASAAAALARRGGSPPPVLRVELEEFSQLFESPTASQGVLRLRCTLLENTGGGERLVAQRRFSVQRPATSADAPGGVRALAAATDAAAEDIAAWLQQR
ncbi:ABC-type transport auxiliary lipoprotein family protein [Ramlibacter monticola]|uniref:Membrane integrity-associated transporter subunit PqiC n=1 Tax=Ramlibacter monticola TaxID=1926872 RepID=A0A936Z0Y1_9BURK|nr:ABC-type transport auxiliary lipoprotein family protein [Ramlibacter monticola]MBL0392069.1 membrane integrity-associated transporter subunit PqiC [Ramlibacter monticola]